MIAMLLLWCVERQARPRPVHRSACGSCGRGPKAKRVSPAELAQMFHETYSRLAPGYGVGAWSSTEWARTSERHRALLVATAANVLCRIGGRL